MPGTIQPNLPTVDPQAPSKVEEAAQLYGIEHWGQGYFSITEAGHVVVQPTQDPARSIDLPRLIDRKIALPPLLIPLSFLLFLSLPAQRLVLYFSFHDRRGWHRIK